MPVSFQGSAFDQSTPQEDVQESNVPAPITFGSTIPTPASPPQPALNSEEAALLQKRKDAYTYNKSKFVASQQAAFRLYNSINSYALRGEGQDYYGYTDEELDEEDKNFNVRQHRELFQGIPLHYRQELLSARNYKEAQVLRFRMLGRMQDMEMFADAGLGYQFIGGITSSIADPLAWLGGGLVGVAGKTAYKAKQFHQLTKAVDHIRQMNRVTRAGYAAGAGAVAGAAGTAVPFGAMSFYDPAVNASVIEQEVTGAAVTGAVIPGLVLPALGAAGGTAAGFLSNRLVRAEDYADFIGPRQLDRVGPIGKIVQKTGLAKIPWDRVTNIPSWIAGKNPYQIASEANSPKIAGQIFEAGRGTPDDSGRIYSAELQQLTDRRKFVDDARYNEHLEDFIAEHTRNPLKKSWQKWTDSNLKKEFEKGVFPYLWQLEEGTNPRIALVTNPESTKTDHILLDAAESIFGAYKNALEGMAEAGVAGAREMLEAGNIIPKRFNIYQINNNVDIHTKKRIAQVEAQRARRAADAGKSAPAPLNDAEKAKLRKAAFEEVQHDIQKLTFGPLREQLRGDAYFKSQLEAITGVELSDLDIFRFTRVLSGAFARGVVDDATKRSSHIHNTLMDSIESRLSQEINKVHASGLVGNLTGTQLSDLDAKEMNLALRAFLKEYMLELNPMPHNENYFFNFIKTNPKHVISNQPDKRWDLNIMKKYMDDDLYGTLMNTGFERTGQKAIAMHVEFPEPGTSVGATIPHTINGPRMWEEASKQWKLEASAKGKDYGRDFWEDTWRAFMGERTHHHAPEGLGPVVRRVLTGAQQSTLGLMGWSQLSDISNVLVRGWHGKLAAVESLFPQKMWNAIGQEYRGNKSELIEDMRTLLGDTMTPFLHDRGDFHTAEFRSRNPDFGDSAKWWGEKARKLGTRIDNIQAYGSRALGAVSGLNVATQYLATAAQKSMVKELDLYFKKAATKDFSPTERGLMRQLGLDINDLNRLKASWEKAVTYHKDDPTKGITRLDHTLWSPEEVNEFTLLFERGMGFMMGTATRGELPRRLDNPYITAILQNRRYSMGAHEKALMGGLDIGGAHLFHHFGLAMSIGVVATLARELVKGGPEGVEDLLNEDGGVVYRRAASSAPVAGNILDTSGIVAAPLMSFFDTDWANQFHFGYNRYDKGPARGGLDALLEQVPVYKYTKDGFMAVQDLGHNFDEGDSFGIFINEILKLSPAPLGNSIGSLILNNILELDEEATWQ